MSSRRTFLVATASGLAGLPFADAARPMVPGGKAKSTILFFLCGGASQIDTWDMKPNAPAEVRGPFKPIDTSAAGVGLCEHLPLLARQMHHLAVVNSVDGTDPTNSHLAYYCHLTGHTLDSSFVAMGGERPRFFPTRSRSRGSPKGRRTSAADSSPAGLAFNTIRSTCSGAWRPRRSFRHRPSCWTRARGRS